MKENYGIDVWCKKHSIWARFVTLDSLEEARQLAQTIAIKNDLWHVVEIVKILSQAEDDYQVIEIFPCGNEKALMCCKEVWGERMVRNETIIDQIDVEGTEEYPENVCFVKLGYYHPISRCGYFHFTSISGFIEGLREVRKISETTEISVVKEYLYWAFENPTLYKSNNKDGVLKELNEMLNGK